MNNLNYQVRLASHRDYIIPGFNVFGYEDALAVIHAAESYQLPVMLMVNRDANQVMGVEHWAALLLSLIHI